MTLELLAFSWNVDPETTVSTNRAGAFNGKADEVSRLGRGRQVDVAPLDIRRSSIIQGKIVDVSGRRNGLGSHFSPLHNVIGVETR